MKEGKSYLSWPGSDDELVVREMLIDPISEQWYDCHTFVMKLVQGQAKNISRDSWEDITQDVMMRIHHSLPSFKHQCKLRTWVYGIVHSCVIDAYRKNMRIEPFTTSLNNPPGTPDGDDNFFPAITAETVEDVCIVRDDLRNVLDALREYVASHAHPERNAKILELVLYGGFSLEEAAQAAGCSAPVAGYVVREAKSFVRIKLDYHRKRP